MPQAVAVEGKPGFKVGHGYSQAIDFLEEGVRVGSVHGEGPAAESVASMSCWQRSLVVGLLVPIRMIKRRPTLDTAEAGDISEVESQAMDSRRKRKSRTYILNRDFLF